MEAKCQESLPNILGKSRDTVPLFLPSMRGVLYQSVPVECVLRYEEFVLYGMYLN